MSQDKQDKGTQERAMVFLKYDRRMTESFLAKGQLTKEELKKHLDALPDLAARVEVINLGDVKDRLDSH